MSLRSKPLYPRMVRKPPFTVEVPDIEPVDGETIPRRNVRCPDKLQSQPEEGTSTVWDIVKRSASKFGDRRALGSRNLIKKHNRTTKVKKLVDGKLQEVDKNWTYFELSGYNYMSFKEYETFVTEIGAGLRKLGLVSYDRVHMFAATR
jgi:long-chain acyl-CoA synthetase